MFRRLIILVSLILVAGLADAQTSAPKSAPAKKATVAPAPKAPEPVVITKEVIKEVEKRVEMPVPTPAPITLGMAIAGVINAAITFAVLWFGAKMTWVRARYPMVVPLAAPFVGLLVAWAQGKLTTMWPDIHIDFDPLLALFAGAAAMTLAQVKVQSNRQTLAKDRAGVTGIRPVLDADGGPI
jgi:hypothetical protein